MCIRDRKSGVLCPVPRPETSSRKVELVARKGFEANDHLHVEQAVKGKPLVFDFQRLGSPVTPANPRRC